jgi:hypothetical protein
MPSIAIRLSSILIGLASIFQIALGQDLAEQHRQIRAAIERNDSLAARATLEGLRSSDARDFALNNYDYLLARLSERRGDRATAAANYMTVLQRTSVLRAYALWHLARIARSTGDLVQERSDCVNCLVTRRALSCLRRQRCVGASCFESADYVLQSWH